ncbi:hypothetical protein BH11ARM2_BH11ARM2_02760 [soil metagenome]
MNRHYSKTFGLLAFLACSAAASAQATYDPACWPPMSTAGPSIDYGAQIIPQDPADDPLFGAAFGVQGTDTFASNPEICGPGGSLAVPGRISFTIGPTGSIQSTDDDYLRLSYGSPLAGLASTSYAIIRSRAATDTAYTTELIGQNAAFYTFPGASDRYALAAFNTTNYSVQLQVDVIGEGARVSWQITNTAAAARVGALWFGHWVTFLNNDLGRHGANFITVPGQKPLSVGRRFQRTLAAARPGEQAPLPMVDTASFAYSQENAYGLRIFNNASTDGSLPVDQTPVDEMAIGIVDFLLNIPLSASVNTMGDFIFADARFADYDRLNYDDAGFIQKFSEATLEPGAINTVVSYYGSTWSKANYARPFTAVVDSPPIVSTSDATAETLNPNPFTFRVYVDNTRGYSAIDKEIPLDNVQIKVTLPAGITDATDPNNQRTTITKFISRVEPRKLAFTDFNVRVSTEVFGIQPYTVEITTQTGVRKLIQGEFNIAATPRLRLPTRANLVTTPFLFGNSTWETILSQQVDTDFRAFTWDPVQQEYVPQTGPERGKGTWVLTENPNGQSIPLGGNPKEPTDQTNSGAPLITLQPGWNMIGNPYNYAVPLGQLVGVNTGNPELSFTFRELVDQGILGGSLAYWDNDAPVPDYRFISGDADLIIPNRGYWIRVDGATPVVIRFPRVFTPFLPERSVPNLAKWKLQLAARTSEALDGQNFVGVANSATAAKSLKVDEPPMSPAKQAVGLSIQEGTDKPRLYAQTLADSAGRKEWTVRVSSKSDGPVTLTWPNMNQVPKNVQFRLVDTATGASKLLRRTSGYTYTAEANVVRQFKLSMEPGTVARALIGSVTATRSGRSANSPLSIAYSLSANATTTVRILQGGREIYVPVLARADQAGQRSAVWNLRDSANRSVAPGSYTVEVTAESETGERVRSFTVINVVR